MFCHHLQTQYPTQSNGFVTGKFCTIEWPLQNHKAWHQSLNLFYSETNRRTAATSYAGHPSGYETSEVDSWVRNFVKVHLD